MQRESRTKKCQHEAAMLQYIIKVVADAGELGMRVDARGRGANYDDELTRDKFPFLWRFHLGILSLWHSDGITPSYLCLSVLYIACEGCPLVGWMAAATFQLSEQPWPRINSFTHNTLYQTLRRQT